MDSVTTTKTKPVASSKGASKKNGSGRDAKPDVSVLPPLYHQPAVLHSETHAGKGLRRSIDYRFAAGVNAVPVHVGEFLPASRHYPIVFAEAAVAMPLVVLGFRDRQNAFVDGHGRWKDGLYLPEYVRRYPFIAAEKPDGTKVLAIDEVCDRLAETGDSDVDPFFEEGGDASDLSKSALALCGRWQDGYRHTEALADALVEMNVLNARKASIRLPDGRQHELGGFRVVDEKALHELPEGVVADWHRKGWLGLIHLHLASWQNWRGLLEAENQ